MQSPPFSKAGASAAVQVLQLSQALRRHPSIGYPAALVAVGSASFIQWLAQDQYAGAPFLTIYPAIILSTVIGGRGPGFLGAALAGATQFGLFIPQFHSIAFASYAIDATICVMLIDYINRTLDLLVIGIDQEKQAKQHQYLLTKELHHRIQNLFTVIQAIIQFSLPGDGLVRESAIKRQLIDRLCCMAATNKAITESMRNGVDLPDLVTREIRGFESKFDIGVVPNLTLSPQIAQNFSLILHELVVNALKYGALSTPAGRVTLRLDLTPSVLTFRWQERGGPQIAPPARTGFGSRMLGALAESFCRTVVAAYDPAGFSYMLQMQIHSDRLSGPKPAPNEAIAA
jgi:two-component sensor histidine kinase